MKKIYGSIAKSILLLSLILVAACSKDDSPASSSGDTIPVITALTADKTTITFGAEDPATITCAATGGNLKYTWQVDLGDIQPLNSDRSKIKFTGAACCVGDKIINCTVSNGKGSVTQTISLKIIEKITVPEIISIQSDKTQIKSGSESATITCNAIGGNLKFKWAFDCGSVAYKNADSSKISYTAGADCAGSQTIKCTVTNEKGSVNDTFVISVNK